VDWVNELPELESLEGETLEGLRHECTVVLIPELESEAEAVAYLESNYEELFEQELSAWSLDRALWPDGRDLGMFRGWFEIVFPWMVLDAVEGEIEEVEYVIESEADAS
jgi:hypothetical protein